LAGLKAVSLEMLKVARKVVMTAERWDGYWVVV